MKRYKELKYDKKVYTEQWKIDEILFKEGFQWFLDCEVEEVRIEILKRTLVFNSGTFFNGTWKFGAFRDGVWKYGIWENGVWFNGKWLNGVFKDGIIEDGKFFHGKMEKGIIRGGDFYHMEISREVKKQEPKKEEVKQKNTQIPQGEKITENMKKTNIKSFEEFRKTNEEFYDEEFNDFKSDLSIDPDETDPDFIEPEDLLTDPDSDDEMFNDIEEDPGDDKITSDNEEEDLVLSETDPEEEIIREPRNRAEEWKTLSSNPGSRKIHRTMKDYLDSIGMTMDLSEPEEKEPKLKSGKSVRRKQ